MLCPALLCFVPALTYCEVRFGPVCSGTGICHFFRRFSFQDSSGHSEIAGRICAGSRAWEVPPQLLPTSQAGLGFMAAAAKYKITLLVNPFLPGSLMPEALEMPSTGIPPATGALLELLGLPWRPGGSRSRGGHRGLSLRIWGARLSCRVLEKEKEGLRLQRDR